MVGEKMEILIALIAIVIGFGVSYLFYRPYVVTSRGLIIFFLTLKEKELNVFTENNIPLITYKDFEKYIDEGKLD